MVLMPPRGFTSYPGLAVGEPSRSGTLFRHVWTWKYTDHRDFSGPYIVFSNWIGFCLGGLSCIFLDPIGVLRARIPIL